MEKKKLSLSRRLSLGAMVAALTLLFLYASEVLTGFRFLCAALSGIFIVVLTQEDLFGTAWLARLTGMSFDTALTAGVIPFIPGDLTKIVLALLIGPTIRARLRQAGIAA